MSKESTQKTFNSLIGINLLIVDDELINQKVIANMVKLWGANSDIANNGFEALDKIRAKNYDIILMDLKMPELDGFQTSDKIRQEMPENKKDIPIIALTGTADKSLEKKLKDSGINDIVSKPFPIEELHSKIVSLIK